jgi:uncharacterized coiled-coil protein SlyX
MANEDITERLDRIEARQTRLEQALTALSNEVCKHYPVRPRDRFFDQLNAVVTEANSQAAILAADARRQALEAELAALGKAA